MTTWLHQSTSLIRHTQVQKPQVRSDAAINQSLYIYSRSSALEDPRALSGLDQRARTKPWGRAIGPLQQQPPGASSTEKSLQSSKSKPELCAAQGRPKGPCVSLLLFTDAWSIGSRISCPAAVLALLRIPVALK